MRRFIESIDVTGSTLMCQALPDVSFKKEGWVLGMEVKFSRILHWEIWTSNGLGEIHSTQLLVRQMK